MPDTNGTESTTQNIFADNCERYWAAGLPVMPLKAYSPNGGKDGKPTGKEAVVMNWQSLGSRMPNEAERTAWKLFHRNGNIGLPLGPASGLVAIDIDTDDPMIMGILNKVLPPSPWQRVGKKGMVRIYKYDGQPIIRIKYRDADDKLQSLVEMLGAGSQIVLPPSIHPNTAKPYYANKDLVDVLDQVQSLPPNIEQILRDALSAAGLKVGSSAFGSVTEYVSAGNRDNHLVGMAGLFSRDIIKGNKTLMEAVSGIEVAAMQFMAKVYGDDIDPKKGPQKLIEFLIRDVTGPKGKALPKGWDDGLSDTNRVSWGLDMFDADSERQTHSQLVAYFNAEVERTGVRDNIDQFVGMVRKVLVKVVAGDLDPIEEDQLITHMANVSGKKLTVAAIRRQLQSLRLGPVAGTNHTELAQHVLKDLQEIKGEIRCYAEVLWQWMGSHWAKMDDAVVLRHIAEEYGDLRAGLRANDHKGILTTLKVICTKDLQTTAVSGINFVNGFLTEDLEMLDHNPDYGMTYVLPYAYEPDKAGKATRWHRMLVDYWGEDADYAEKVTCLGEVIALTMFGKMTEMQQAICLYGVGHSGKSRIMEIIQALMPKDASTTLPPTMWGDRFGPAQLVGKLLNFAGELSETQLIDSAKFKQIVGGEMIDAQNKNEKGFTFRPKAAHWFASNHTPKSKDSSDGFTRRWLFFCFTKAFPKDGRVVKEYDRIVVAEEREAIAAWAVQHMVRLRTEGFRLTEPISSIEQREHLENELNSVRDFLSGFQGHGWMRLGAEAHKGISDQQNYTSFTTLWSEYRTYCLSQSVAPVGFKILAKRLNHLQGQFGFKLETVSGAQNLPIQVYRYLTLAKDRKAAA